MSDVNVAVVYGANGLEFTKTEQTLPLTLNVVANGIVGPAGPTGPTGATGATGATGPAGPAPAGTGLVSVTGGVLDVPSTLSARVAADAANLRTQLGLGTVATQDANNVTLTGGTLEGVGVVTGTYTSNANEAILRSCRKGSAGTITKGQVVYITGSTGSHLNVELADADLEATSSKTFGVAVENVTSSQEGYVIVEGLLTGLSNLPTASFADGDSLWLSSTAGGWQNTPPANPAHGVYLGRVITASNGSAGKAYIKVQNGYELDELHDVVISSPGPTHALYYDDATLLWKNRAAANADLSAITVFTRFDSDQSATATQKRTARYNIGFSDSFTTAELLALSSSDSARLRLAYCSDCYSSAGQQWDSMGDMVYWSGAAWLTQADRVPLCVDWEDWVYHMARNSSGHGARPSAVWWGWTGSTGHLDQSYTSGAAAFATGTGADSDSGAMAWVSPGTTSGGVSRGIIGPLSGRTKSATYRRIGFAVSHLYHEVGVSGDSFHWRYTFEPTAFSATMARQTDHIGFVGDPFNLLGEGATGSNIYAYVRLNGTTLLWADTGISNSQPAWLVGTWEPTSGLSGAGIFKVVSWRNGVKTNHHGANSGTFGASTVHAVVGSAKGGAGTTFLRAYRRADYVIHKYYTAPSFQI